MAKVSIIIPNYNHAPYLRQRIESVLKQTYTDFEVILLDDRSEDESLEILKKYEKHPKIKGVFINNENSGSSFLQWKKGINLAEGEYIWIAESDDVADPQLLENLTRLLDKNGTLDVAFAQSNVINSDGKITGIWTDPWTKHCNVHTEIMINGREFIDQFMLEQNVIPNASAVLIRKSAIPSLKPIFKMKLNGDWLFWIIVLSNSRIAFVNKPLNFFRKHAHTVRQKALGSGINLIEYLQILNYIENNGLASNPAKVATLKEKIIRSYLYSLAQRNISTEKVSYFLSSIKGNYILLGKILIEGLLNKAIKPFSKP